MIEFFKKDTEQKTADPEKLDYDKTNKCDKVIKILVDKGEYICQLEGYAYIRVNSIVFGIKTPCKYCEAFNRCIFTDWETYNVLKPSYGHWRALWEEETPSEHAVHILMNKINACKNMYIDAVLKETEEVTAETEEKER